MASLVLPAFVAGVLTFLAPCTLPLVPGYLGFISGTSATGAQTPGFHRKVFLNGVFYVVGFSLVFILLGSLFGLGGAALIQYRVWLSRIGGLFVIFFGLYLLNVIRLPVLTGLMSEHRLHPILKPGNAASSLIFGAAFAFGWTPCIGPILGSILILASSTATVGQGAFLLTVFSLGLAVPFLIVAAAVGPATQAIRRFGRVLRASSIVGGLLLILLGVLLLTNNFGVWISWFYQVFDFINYDRLLDFL